MIRDFHLELVLIDYFGSPSALLLFLKHNWNKIIKKLKFWKSPAKPCFLDYEIICGLRDLFGVKESSEILFICCLCSLRMLRTFTVHNQVDPDQLRLKIDVIYSAPDNAHNIIRRSYVDLWWSELFVKDVNVVRLNSLESLVTIPSCAGVRASQVLTAFELYLTLTCKFFHTVSRPEICPFTFSLLSFLIPFWICSTTFHWLWNIVLPFCCPRPRHQGECGTWPHSRRP